MGYSLDQRQGQRLIDYWNRYLVLQGLSGDNQYCTDPSARVLDVNLNWRPVGDIKIGDVLIGFDEKGHQNNRRRLQQAIVLDTVHFKGERKKVFTEHGEIIVSPDHPFLGNAKTNSLRWARAHKLSSDHRIVYLPPWREEQTKSAGWMEGILDGEGALRITKTPSVNKIRRSLQLDIAQKAGKVWDRIRSELEQRDATFSEQLKEEANKIVVSGGVRVLQTLGLFQPQRLVQKFKDYLPGGYGMRFLKSNVITMENHSSGDLVGIKTSTGTFFAEGYASHNCSAEGQMSHLQRLVPPPATVLFLGAGEGREVYDALQLGYDAYGVTLGEPDMKYADERYDLISPTQRMFLCDCHFLPEEWANRFDFVGAFQTFEHSFSGMIFLLEVYRVLKKNGWFYAEVPSADFCENRDWHHTQSPTPEQIRGWFSKIGYRNGTSETMHPGPWAARSVFGQAQK